MVVARTSFRAASFVSVRLSILVWNIIQMTVYMLLALLRKAAFSLADSEGCNAALESRKAAASLAAAVSAEDEVDASAKTESPVAQTEALDEQAAIADTASQPSDDATIQDDFMLRRLQISAYGSSGGEACRGLEEAVAQVRVAGHEGVRFSVQVESDRPASVAVLGSAPDVSKACKALASHVTLDASEERSIGAFFMLQFTVREAWDLPEDDEFAEATIGSDWVDLGLESETVGEDVGARDDADSPTTPQAVLRKRLRELLHEQDQLHLFMDGTPLASSQTDSVHVEFAGSLPGAWDAAARAALACEARGVYLSRRFGVVFQCPEALQGQLEDQVESALSHCQGTAERVSMGPSGFGLTGCNFSILEDLADNVSAVLSGSSPPGWHRLEWTPHGDGGLRHHTY